MKMFLQDIMMFLSEKTCSCCWVSTMCCFFRHFKANVCDGRPRHWDKQKQITNRFLKGICTMNMGGASKMHFILLMLPMIFFFEFYALFAKSRQRGPICRLILPSLPPHFTFSSSSLYLLFLLTLPSLPPHFTFSSSSVYHLSAGKPYTLQWDGNICV